MQQWAFLIVIKPELALRGYLFAISYVCGLLWLLVRNLNELETFLVDAEFISGWAELSAADESILVGVAGK